MNLPNKRGNLLTAFVIESYITREQLVRPASNFTKIKMPTEITAQRFLQSSSSHLQMLLQP